MSVSIHDQLRCAKRELAMRRNVYPRRVEAGRMAAGEAFREIERMGAIVETLSLLAAREPEAAT